LASKTKNPSEKIKAVLFDLDGTLVEFKFKVKESREAMISWLGANGFASSTFTDGMRTQALFDAAMKEWQGNRTLSSKFESFEVVRAHLSGILEDFEFRSFQEARPHPGSLRVLKKMKDSRIPSAVVTNSGRRPVQSILSVFGFLPYLTLVITRDEMERLKPEPDGLIKAMNLLRADKRSTVYVGDSLIDVEAAKAAGIRCIALATGLYDKASLAQSHPDYLIDKIEELESIVVG
jgi:HAD superfamily hydrolase (TIGR01549 family)